MELDWIEWKSGYDLLQPEAQSEMSRHLLGFASRDPSAAAAVAGGCAYLVVGVEPANVQGIRPIDSAQLSKAIDQYPGGIDGPRWSPDYVNCQGRAVLVITVEPPAWGDPFHTLRRGFRNYLPGAIFVRRKGETEQANPAEILMLTERATRRTPQIAIGLRWAGANPEILPAGVTAREIDVWAESERSDLGHHLERHETPAARTYGRA